jgi:virulence-associated protein VapD
MRTVERKQYKAVNFDLVIQRVEAEFGEGKRRAAYARIKRFLEKNGFEHRQYSGYRSTSTMTYTELLDVCTRLFVALPWLGDCASKFDVTNIGREFDMLGIVREQMPDADADFDPTLDSQDAAYHHQASP